MCGFQGTRNRRMKRGCAERSQVGGPGYEVTGLKPRERGPAQTLQGIPVVMAKGIHLFPYRTQKLSLSAPMVLGWRRPGRVGRCRIPKRNQPHECGVDFFLGLIKTWLSGLFPAYVHIVLGWDRSPPPPVADEGGRSVGNLKERPKGSTIRFPGDAL